MRFFILLLFVSLAMPTLHAEEDEVPSETAYYEFKPDIVSNLHGGVKYIRASIQIMTRRADMLYEFETHEPALRHAILMILSDKDGAQIKTLDGKEALRKEIAEQLSSIMDEKSQTKGLVADVFFPKYHAR